MPVLDGVRGLAILLVMMVHLRVMNSTTIVDKLFSYGSGMGWIGVDLFFVLSGFLITGILYDAKGSPHYFRNFYARRTLRIFPLYYVVVCLALIAAPNIEPLEPYLTGPRPLENAWTHWFYLSNFAIAAEQQFGSGVLIVAWSLAIEEQFYLLWAPVVRYLSLATLQRLCIELMAIALLLRIGMVWYDVYPAALYVLPFTRMDALAFGSLIALLGRKEGGLARLKRPATIAAACASLVVLGATVWDRDPSWGGEATQTIGYTALAVFFGSFLVIALEAAPRQVIRRALLHPFLRAMGTYSYALYLLHLPVRGLIRDHLFGPEAFPTVLGSQLPGQLIFYLVAAVPCIALAWVSWHVFEKHFLKMKARFAPAPHGSHGVGAAA
jgi:peptidoglycan/LPS O-acetylase OafA/YrhL